MLGFSVAIFDRDTAGSRTDKNGIGLNLVGDVSSKESVNQAIARCVDVLGSVDILANNAGICPVAPAVSTSIEDFQKNLTGQCRGYVYMLSGRHTVDDRASSGMHHQHVFVD